MNPCGPMTERLNAEVCVMEPLVACTVMLCAVTSAAEEEAESVRVEELVEEESEAVTPEGRPERERATWPVKPLPGVTKMEGPLALAPWFNVTADGTLRESVKSGAGGGGAGVLAPPQPAMKSETANARTTSTKEQRAEARKRDLSTQGKSKLYS